MMNFRPFSLLIGIPAILFLGLSLGFLTAPLFFSRNYLGEKFAKLGLYLQKPFHATSEFLIRDFIATTKPETYGNESLESLEILKRNAEITIGLAKTPMMTLFAAAGGFSDYLGALLSKQEYLAIDGKAPPKLEGREFRFFSLNACMFFGGLPLLYGGVFPAKDRVNELSDLILNYDPDFILMQEVSFGPALLLIEKLENHYSHFYTKIGPNPWKSDTCLFAASKFPIVNSKFIPFPFHSWMKRGLFCMETSNFWILETHLENGDDEKSFHLRELEIALITHTIKDLKEKTGKPCFLFGDLNIKRTGFDTDEYTKLEISQHFIDPYVKKYPFLNEASATYTDFLEYALFGANPKNSQWEIIDYALLDKESENKFQLKIKQIDKTLNIATPEHSLSDHRALFLNAISNDEAF